MKTLNILENRGTYAVNYITKRGKLLRKALFKECDS